MKNHLKTVTIGDRSLTPSKIVCVGRNYVEHIRELNNEIPKEMVIFNKPNSAISSELCSFKQEPLHYEGEICFLVENGQFSAVGFGLDITKRKLQSELKARGLPWERAKAFDGSALFSSFVTIDSPDNAFSVQLDINGQNIQSANISLMMNKPAEILTEIQSFMSLDDGDIIMTGTPKGVGIIQPGDIFHGKILRHKEVITDAEWIAKWQNE